MSKILDKAETQVSDGNKKEAANQIAAFTKSWNKDKKLMGTFIRHSELDIANVSAAKLQAYLDDENDTDFLAECESLKMQLHHIMDTERFTFDNLL